MKVRQPIVSGRFYPNSAYELSTALDEYFSTTQHTIPENAKAIISPHAGYAYSGQVAANAFKAIDPNKQYPKVFLIGSSHQFAFKGAALPSEEYFSTPMGEIPVDTLIIKALATLGNDFFFMPEAHATEHSLEVQLPFLQFWLKHPFSIIPILIGTQKPDVLINIAEALKKHWADEDSLFIISSDFSHYPKYSDAVDSDLAIAESIEKKSVKAFSQAIEYYEEMGIKNLHTTICGASAVKVLLHIIENNHNYTIKKLFYENSGDTIWGDKDKVVGYWAMGVY
jgi:AmmeMemoRadiSam system protein B